MDLEIKKDLVSNWFKLLQESFCNDINELESHKTKFISTSWKRNQKKDEGGGEYRILKNGKVFDKVGVNFSKVYGKFPKNFKNILGAHKDPRFWASGISVVMHMKNPQSLLCILTQDLSQHLNNGLVEAWMRLIQKMN